MEVRCYRSQDDLIKGKQFFCVRVECPDAFEFDKTLDVFKTLYGSNIVFVVIAV